MQAQDAAWGIRVNSVNWDAFSWIVANENWYTPPSPPVGLQDVVVNITATYRGTAYDPSGVMDLDWWNNSGVEGVAQNGNTYRNRNGVLLTCTGKSAGSIPNSTYDAGPLLPNQSVQVNVCWQVLSTDVPTLALHYLNVAVKTEGWFALR